MTNKNYQNKIHQSEEVVNGKMLPQALDLEEAVLGAIINEPDSFLKVQGILKPDSFYNEENKIIYGTICEMNKGNKPIDLLTITRRLRDVGKIHDIGGPIYLTNLSSKIAMSHNIESYAKIVAQKYMQRELIRISYETIERAYDENEDIDDTLSKIRSQIESIEDITVKDGKTTKEVASSALTEIESDCFLSSEGSTSGIDTGFFTLNEAIGGWKAPNFVVLGARPSVGKTTEALHFAITAAKAGYPVNLYTYEMTSEDLFKIALAGESQVNRTGIRDGKIDESDWKKINESLKVIEDLPIIWYDNPNIKASQIRSNTFKNKRNGQCDLVIIDYIQLIPAEDRRQIREQQVSEISRTLKNITTSIKIPVIALSQLNREIEKRSDPEPINSDLRESGTLEQDADVIIFSYVFKDEYGEVSERWNKISKNRRGKVGKFQIYDDGQMSSLSDVPMTKDKQDIEYTDYMPINNNFENDKPF